MSFTFPNKALEHIRPEIQELAKRGNITLAEYKELRCNSYEFEHLAPHLTDEALLYVAEHCFNNCQFYKQRPWRSYNEAAMGFYGPELVRRMKRLLNGDKSQPKEE